MLRRLRRERTEPAVAPKPAVRRRQEYKAVWTEVAATIDSAKAYVVGANVSEDSFAAGGRDDFEILNRAVAFDPDDVVLEIGCGVGRVGAVVAEHCREWIGCDVSPTMLDHARERLAGRPNVRLVEISGFDLAQIPDASVDVAYCTVVFMHLDEWDRFNYVAEAHRVLRSGGRVYIDNFNLCSDEGWHLFEEHRALAPEERPPAISKSSTPDELRTYLRRAGFSDVTVEEDKLWVRAHARA